MAALYLAAPVTACRTVGLRDRLPGASLATDAVQYGVRLAGGL